LWIVLKPSAIATEAGKHRRERDGGSLSTAAPNRLGVNVTEREVKELAGQWP
jgi:hypothetical protein